MCVIQGEIYIDITAVLRAVFYIARVLACNILYLPEGASPRRRYFRIARRAPRARVLYDFTARMHEDDIVYIHQRAQRAGIALKTKYSLLVDINIGFIKFFRFPPTMLHAQLHTFSEFRHLKQHGYSE